MLNDQPASSIKGASVEDRSGTPLGTVEAVFLDDTTGQLSWAVIGNETVVPMAGADLDGSRLRLSVDADTVRSAPPLGGRAHLEPDHLEALRRHYAGVGPDTAGRHAAGTGYGFSGNQAGSAPASPAGSGDAAMTLSEERLAVGMVVAPYSRAVLRIETVSEQVMVPVTVTRQQARIEYLPITSPTTSAGVEPAVGGRTDAQVTPWVTLYGEEPVVEMRQVPLERVRLATTWTHSEQTVTAQLRHEEIALDGEATQR
jgi:sporulation protein YlmC with PRC-barrel domain